MEISDFKKSELKTMLFHHINQWEEMMGRRMEKESTLARVRMNVLNSPDFTELENRICFCGVFSNYVKEDLNELINYHYFKEKRYERRRAEMG